MADPELEAIQMILAVLEPLDSPSKQRVLDYVGLRLGLGTSISSTAPSRIEAVSHPSGGWPTGAKPTEEFAEVFSRAAPQSDKERALVAAYWLQVKLGAENFVSQSLNIELKNLGHGVGNITDALDRLIDERPSLVLQLRKEGSTKQARKVYKLTHEGVKRVEQMVNRRIGDE